MKNIVKNLAFFSLLSIVFTTTTTKTTIPAVASLNCTSKEIKCNKTSKCIRTYQVCDGYNDCSDKSDETNCSCNYLEFNFFYYYYSSDLLNNNNITFKMY